MRRKERLFVAFRMLTFFVPVAFLLLMALSSCSSSSSDDEEDLGDDPKMEVCKRVAKVANAVDEYFDQSQSIEELSSHLREIRKIPYVEDAYTTSTTLFVQIKNYGKISYSFFNDQGLYFDDNLDTRTRSDLIEDHPIMNGKKVCIANAQYVEYLYENKKYNRKYISEEAQKYFNSMGYKASLINSPNLSFFTDTIYNDYDIIFFIAHGEYDDKKDLHWFLINEELENLSADLDPEDVYKYYNNQYTSDEVSFAKYKVTRFNEKYAWYNSMFEDQYIDVPVAWWVMVSDKFIANSQKKISKEKWGEPIFFSVPCQSLMGNDKMGQAFIDKGFGAYYGYTEVNYYGQAAFLHMLNNMLSGMSLENAFNALPEIYKDENKDTELVAVKISEEKFDEIPKAKLESLPRDENAEIYKTCFLRAATDEPVNISTGNEIQIHLNGKAPYYSYYYNYDNGKIVQQTPNPFGYGFFISSTSDIKDAYQVCFLSSVEEEYCEYKNNWVSFHYDLIYKPLSLNNLIVPGQDYYVWSYIFDGYEFYFGDRKSFTTRVSVGDGEIPDIPGTDF